MKTTSATSLFRTLIVALFLFALAIGESLAQGRQPVTTHPSGPCRENINTSVTKTPWKFSGLGFIRATSVFDTLEIQSTATQLLAAVGGNLTNYTLVIQKAVLLFNYEGVVYGEWTRTVTVKTTGTKCVNDKPVAVNETKVFTESTGWKRLFGPITWTGITPTKLKFYIDQATAALPK
ncbi:MAG: hypothetical protein IT211_09050 [Armatimonadetes bacterium]|nr:hypothetical protein [Armatimonadota bacterium]